MAYATAPIHSLFYNACSACFVPDAAKPPHSEYKVHVNLPNVWRRKTEHAKTFRASYIYKNNLENGTHHLLLHRSTACNEYHEICVTLAWAGRKQPESIHDENNYYELVQSRDLVTGINLTSGIHHVFFTYVYIYIFRSYRPISKRSAHFASYIRGMEGWIRLDH